MNTDEMNHVFPPQEQQLPPPPPYNYSQYSPHQQQPVHYAPQPNFVYSPAPNVYGPPQFVPSYAPSAPQPIIIMQQSTQQQQQQQHQQQPQPVQLVTVRQKTSHGCCCLIFLLTGGLSLPCWICSCLNCCD